MIFQAESEISVTYTLWYINSQFDDESTTITVGLREENTQREFAVEGKLEEGFTSYSDITFDDNEKEPLVDPDVLMNIAETLYAQWKDS